MNDPDQVINHYPAGSEAIHWIVDLVDRAQLLGLFLRLVNNDARLILRGKLTGQRHDRVQTESQIATVDSCFDLVGSLQHGVARNEIRDIKGISSENEGTHIFS